MSSGPPTKKKRQGRRNNNQIEYLVDYLIQHPNVATGKFMKMNARDALQGSWEELVRQLNEMRSNGQSEKNVKSWKEVGTMYQVHRCPQDFVLGTAHFLNSTLNETIRS